MDTMNEAAKEWTKAWRIVAQWLKELRIPDVDHNAKAILARLGKENMLVVEAESAESPTCGWEANELHGHYQTDCGQGFFFAEDGDLTESAFRHCMYCGGAIVPR